ncbi:hypothetical protein RI367_001539 [Sorochytrium milnesiophthora]
MPATFLSLLLLALTVSQLVTAVLFLNHCTISSDFGEIVLQGDPIFQVEDTKTRAVADLPGLQLYGTSPAGVRKMLATNGVVFQLEITRKNVVSVYAEADRTRNTGLLLCRAKLLAREGQVLRDATVQLTMAGRLEPGQVGDSATSWFRVDRKYRLSTEQNVRTIGMPTLIKQRPVTVELDTEPNSFAVTHNYSLCYTPRRLK